MAVKQLEKITATFIDGIIKGGLKVDNGNYQKDGERRIENGV